MSFAFTVGPLSAMRRLDVAALRDDLDVPRETRVFDFAANETEPYMRGAAPHQVTRWWQATQERHLEETGGRVSWDESSGVRRTLVLDAVQATELLYLSGYVEVFGTGGLARGFRGRRRTPEGRDEELAGLLAATDATRFRHDLVGADYYLPYPGDAVLEVPDWTGARCVLGSLPRLAAEYEELVAIVAAEAPDAAEAGQRDVPDGDRLAVAYGAARRKLELARFGLEQGLPYRASA